MGRVLRVHSFTKFILFAVEDVSSQLPDPVYHACPLLTASLPQWSLFYWFLLRQGLTSQPWMTWNSLCR